jgi:toxin FitB
VSFLLDTNLVSEWVKVRPNPGVLAWLSEADEDRLFLSVVTLAELRHGVERLPDGVRRRRLDAWVRDDLRARFAGRIIPVDDHTAEAWGVIVAASEAVGRPPTAMDALLAATAKVHGLSLVTRNTGDFERLGVPLVNPWTNGAVGASD